MPIKKRESDCRPTYHRPCLQHCSERSQLKPDRKGAPNPLGPGSLGFCLCLDQDPWPPRFFSTQFTPPHLQQHCLIYVGRPQPVQKHPQNRMGKAQLYFNPHAEESRSHKQAGHCTQKGSFLHGTKLLLPIAHPQGSIAAGSIAAGPQHHPRNLPACSPHPGYQDQGQKHQGG